MKALSIAALLALVSATTFSTIPANANNCNLGGYNSGFQSSFNPGFNSGFNPGFNSGFNPGFNPGFNSGFNSGFNTGFRPEFNPYAYGTTANSLRFPHNQFFNPFAGNIDGRQAALNARIQQGIQNGRLSTQEAGRLQNRFNQIASLEARLRASGNRLSYKERARLNSDLSRLQWQLNRDLSDRRWW